MENEEFCDSLAHSSSTQSKAMAAPAASLLSLRCPSSPFRERGSGWTIWARNRGLERKERGIPAAQGNSCGLGMRGQKSRSGLGVGKEFDKAVSLICVELLEEVLMHNDSLETLEEKGLINPSGRERTLPLKRSGNNSCILFLMMPPVGIRAFLLKG
uniref:Uncharacterized protein n=1 Tax=Salix viminalis TaxID=40686 RepID=A0A6N2NDL1_SALVM